MEGKVAGRHATGVISMSLPLLNKDINIWFEGHISMGDGQYARLKLGDVHLFAFRQ